MPPPATPGIVHVACAAPEVLARAAADFADRERAGLPGAGHGVFVIPDLHAAGDLARALREASGLPALLLPRITTLAHWAAEVPLPHAVFSRPAREALLYRELEKRSWLGSADLWAVSAELAGLFDELTRHNLVLPPDLAAFNVQLEQAYRAKAGASLTFEARLVHELWNVLARAAGEADAEAAYQLRLSRLADEAAAPLYAVGLGRLAPPEQRFLERYAARAPVHVYSADPGAGGALPRMLAAAWPRATGHDGLRDRADALRTEHPHSPLARRLRIVGASSAEQEAQAVDATVREWLLAGRRRIGIVVQDRLVARRARALLERAQVLVRDEAGWAFSTTSAATVIGRWLDVAGGDCYYRDLLDLMKSPFVFHDWAPEARRRAVWQLERAVREESVIAGLGNFIRLAEERGENEARQMLARIRQGIATLGRGRRPLSGWLAALDASLADVGVRDGLAADSAGRELLDLLERLAHELAGDPLSIDSAEWRRWLSRQLENATFRDRAIESPVVFTHLGATPLRAFDAVLVLGADAAHLPGPDPVSLFFNQGVRAELGLPTWSERVREMEDQLAALVASAGAVVVTWQRMLGGEHNLLAPAFERLEALHRLAYGAGLHDETLLARLPRAEVRTAGGAVAPSRAPAPSAPAMLPRQISASGYNSLLACPYQFYARYVLGLAELDDVQELIEKKDYGNVVHGVLTEFHRAHPRVSALEPGVAERELEAMSARAFSAHVARNYLAQAWLARWKALIPEYLDWQRGWEASGWSWAEGEAWRSIEIATPAGRKLTLRGRLDRADAGPGGAAVIDYKTRDPARLRKSLEAPGEDVQLAVYALLWGQPVSEAMFLAIDRDGVKPVPVGPGLQALAEAARERLGAMYDALSEGAPLRAQGLEPVCGYCEARGLCRRDHWHE